MAVCVLRREGEQAGDAQGDPGGDRLGLDPERDPRPAMEKGENSKGMTLNDFP